MDDNNIQEFEIGQKVLIVGARVKQDDFERDVYFAKPDMSDLVGMVATISWKHKDEYYNGRFRYRLKEFGYIWVDKWLKPINPSDFIYS